MSKTDNHDIHVDDLFVGLTRPTPILGVPDKAFIAELVIVVIAVIASNNPFYLALIFPVHAIMYMISAHDPGAFHNIYIWVITIGRSNQNRGFWGASSLSPLPLKKWQKSD